MLERRALAHTYTPLKRETPVCGSSLAVAWRAAELTEDKGPPDPFRVLMERRGVKGDQRPDRLIEERYLVWATPQDTLYCWHFAWQIQRETGRLNPSYLGFVFNRLEAGPSGPGKWQKACFVLVWFFFSLCACARLSACGPGRARECFFFPECCSREVIVSCASSCDTSDQKHYQVERQSGALVLAADSFSLLFCSCSCDCFFCFHFSASIGTILHC